MANLHRLGIGATRRIKASIDDLYDKVKTRLLGPNATGKRIYITFDRNFSLPGLFEAGSYEEAVQPDIDILNSLIRVTSDYLDASKERVKAKVIHEVNGLIAEARHSGGMDRDEFRGVVNTKLTEVWADAANSVHAIIDTEVNHAKNVSVLDGIVGANLRAGIEDPVVYFVVVRDADLCEECKRLHLLPDGKTPRVWKLSEVSHGYHKKGEDSPSIGGLHPHCRCTLVTLMPGYGFTEGGFISYKKAGHSEYDKQHSLERSEWLGKAEDPPPKKPGKEQFDPSKHPRDPNTGEFIDHEKAFMDSLAHGSKRGRREWDTLSPAEKKDRIDYAKRVLKVLFQRYPGLYRKAVEMPHVLEHIALDEHDNLVDTSDPDSTYSLTDGLNKAERNEPLYHGPTTPAGKRLLHQLQTETYAVVGGRYYNHPTIRLLPTGIIPTYNNLLYLYKNHSNSRWGQLLKYLVHRHAYIDDYDDEDEAAILDKEFNLGNEALLLARGGIRGTQQGNVRSKAVEEKVFSTLQLKHDLSRNVHLYHQAVIHQETLHERIRNAGNLLYTGGEPGTENGEFIVAVRSLRVQRPFHHLLAASFADHELGARSDPALDVEGETQQKYKKYLAIPLSSVMANWHHGGEPTYSGMYHTSEYEGLFIPHKEIYLDEAHGAEHLKLLVPPPPAGPSGPAAYAALTNKKPIKGSKYIRRPFSAKKLREAAQAAKPPEEAQENRLAMSEDIEGVS